MQVARYPGWVLQIVRPGDRPTGAEGVMATALDVAAASVERGGGPFGAIVATPDCSVVGIGWNGVIPERDPTAHAEVGAIRRAAAALGTWRVAERDGAPLTLFTTCAPCIMCTGAIHWAGVPRVVAAATRADAEAVGFIEGPPGIDLPAALRAVGVIYEDGLLRDRARAFLASYPGPVYNARRP